jgi:hypothetical protein
VIWDTAGFFGRCRAIVGDIHEDTGLVCADLIEENGGEVPEEDVSMLRGRKSRVDEFEAEETGLGEGAVFVYDFAEVRSGSVGDEGQGTKVLVMSVYKRQKEVNRT